MRNVTEESVLPVQGFFDLRFERLRDAFAELLNEPDESVPGIRVPQTVFRERDHLFDTFLEDGVEQFLLGGEPSVYRAHSDTGVMCHVVERCLQSTDGEQFARRFAVDGLKGPGSD